ncbi:MAG TPA: hypothetical protein V6D05_08305 [Stenomitos sp.]
MLRVDAFFNTSDYPGHRPQVAPRTQPKESSVTSQPLSFEEVLRQVQRNAR